MFCDELTIKVVAGKGGDGCISFRREKFVAKGGPNGGDGGHGGNVVIRASKHFNTLNHLAHKKIFKGYKGDFGRGKNMTGKSAEDFFIEVPLGTIIFNEDKSEVIADLKNEGDQKVVAKGGKGGLGNARFASSTNQVPRFAETGEPGEEKDLVLELKLVADIGLIGLPSAGKSTLISVISNARPKIAAYHFTTLSPNLGVVNMGKFGGDKNHTFVVADIPGLIEGASEGKGLGHQFLKHIARTKILAHVIDGSLENIEENYKTINKELKQFDKTLSEKEQIIVINKIDLLSEEKILELTKKLKKATKAKKIFAISAAAQKGLKELVNEFNHQLAQQKEIEEAPEPEVEEEQTQTPIIRPELDENKFEIIKITKEDGKKTFTIKGQRIEQVAIMTSISNPEGLERMYHYMNRLGIQKEIEKKGAKFGDKIKIGEKIIPYRK